jgi:hypothetical protein
VLSKEYIAGFFDGEGSIGIYTNGKIHLHLKVQLVQTDTDNGFAILNEIFNRFGGNLSRSISSSGRHKWNWQICSNPALEFLKWIKPCLRIKKDQAILAIAWEASRPKMSRGTDGRILPIKPRDIDIKVSNVMKEMKKLKSGFDISKLIKDLRVSNTSV